MADYPISNVPRRVQYVNSGVGPYAFTFEILVQTDIAVYRGSTLLTLTTDYTVTINANGTGSVTLVVAGTGNITIVGARAIQRSSDYTTGGDLFASTLNTDLDSQTIYSQQLAETLDRTISVPITDASTLDMELPSSATRANKVFAFDSSGNPQVSTNTLAAIDAAVDTIESIAGAASGSSAGISHIASGTGAVATTVQAKLRETVSVADFGAVADATSPTTGTDNSAAFQAAVDTGKSVYIPATPTGFGYRVASIAITKPIRIFGEGMGATLIWPTTGNSCFIVGTDDVEISDLTFIGKTGTGQAEVFGDCIKYDAVTYNAAFVRPIQGCKVERVKFRNLKMNAINVAQPLRESHIRECRFIGMGNASTGRSAIYMRQTLGTPNDSNVLWIDSNMFYRFDTPAINMLRSTLVSPASSGLSYAYISLTNNLIHGQVMNEDGVEIVQPEPTDHVSIEDGTIIMAHGNDFTAIHPEYVALKCISGGTLSKSVDASNNYMNVKSVVGGVTYSRAIANSTGYFVNATGYETATITNNIVNGGLYVKDFLINNGDYATQLDLNISQNVTEAGIILTDYSGATPWIGEIQDNQTRFYTDALNTTSSLTSNSVVSSTTVKGNNGLSEFSGASQAYSVYLRYNSSTTGAFIGSPSANLFQVSTSGGTPTFIVDTTNGIRPGADGTANCGSASFRWNTVFAANATINTSDANEKKEIVDISDVEKRVAVKLKSSMKRFKFKDGNRYHFGTIAQDVKAAFESEGLIAEEYGVFCSDTWTNEDGTEQTRLGIRYDELFAFIISTL